MEKNQRFALICQALGVPWRRDQLSSLHTSASVLARREGDHGLFFFTLWRPPSHWSLGGYGSGDSRTY